MSQIRLRVISLGAGVQSTTLALKQPVIEQWIGISQDEALRMKPSRLAYIAHRWLPLHR